MYRDLLEDLLKEFEIIDGLYNDAIGDKEWADEKIAELEDENESLHGTIAELQTRISDLEGELYLYEEKDRYDDQSDYI